MCPGKLRKPQLFQDQASSFLLGSQILVRPDPRSSGGSDQQKERASTMVTAGRRRERAQPAGSEGSEVSVQAETEDAKGELQQGASASGKPAPPADFLFPDFPPQPPPEGSEVRFQQLICF